MKIPKKGALSNCNNWKGTILLSVHSKILAKLILRWISEAVDQRLRKEQAGFLKGARLHRPDVHLAQFRMAETAVHQQCGF